MDFNLVDLDNLFINNIFISNLIGGYKRAIAFDDKQKKKKKGIYRVSYFDQNDIDKKGNPKLKFNYFYLHNDKPITKEDQERTNKLGLAPAYSDVWVSDNPSSKIQATGIDAKGRKQYRYHPRHIDISQENKILRFQFVCDSEMKFQEFNEFRNSGAE